MKLRYASEWKEAEKLLNQCLAAFIENGWGGRVVTNWGSGMVIPLVDSHDNPNPVYSLLASIGPVELDKVPVGDSRHDSFPLFSGHFAAFQAGDDYIHPKPISSDTLSNIRWDNFDIDWLRRTRPRILIMKAA
jgi:hypothetical protein